MTVAVLELALGAAPKQIGGGQLPSIRQLLRTRLKVHLHWRVSMHQLYYRFLQMTEAVLELASWAAPKQMGGGQLPKIRQFLQIRLSHCR
jgi:hypothetical protein